MVSTLEQSGEHHAVTSDLTVVMGERRVLFSLNSCWEH